MLMFATIVLRERDGRCLRDRCPPRVGSKCRVPLPAWATRRPHSRPGRRRFSQRRRRNPACVNLFAAKLSRFLLGSFSCRATAVISLLYGRQMRSDSRKCAELRARFISTFEYVIVTLPGRNATSFRGQRERRGPLF